VFRTPASLRALVAGCSPYSWVSVADLLRSLQCWGKELAHSANWYIVLIEAANIPPGWAIRV